MPDVTLARSPDPRPSHHVSLAAHESVVTVPGTEADDPRSFATRAAAAIPAGCGSLAVFVFGRLACLDETVAALADAGLRDVPVLATEGAPCHAGVLAGAQIYVAPASLIHRVRLRGEVIGSLFHDGAALHGVFAGLGPRDPTATPSVQASQTIAGIAEAVRHAGFEMGDIVRTWFYNHRILAWYDAFNQVRTPAYAATRFRSGAAPASTGIEGANARGAALSTALWAVHPTDPEVEIEALASPLQGPAPAYGSLFSRAAAVVSGARQRVFVSGTASIAPGGESIWPHDAGRQVDQTMRVIEALLAARGLSLADIDRATAYFKHARDFAVFEQWLRDHEMINLPYIAIQADVCRDELLFELEVDAVCVQ